MSFYKMMETSNGTSQTERQSFHFVPQNMSILIDKLHQYMFVKDSNGYFIYGNQNFLDLLGISIEELQLKTDANFFPPHLVSHFRDKDTIVCSTGSDWDGEETIPFPCGGTRTVWVNKTPLLDANEKSIGVVGIFADVTRSREESNQNLSKRTNDLVHEILLPMQSITSNLENLIANEAGRLKMSSTERKQALTFALSQLHILGMHAENTQKALLGATEKQFVFRVCGIRRIIEESTDSLASYAEQKHIKFTNIKLDGLREYPRAEMSRPDMVRVFKNVFHNAVKYSYSGRGLDNSPYQHRWISTRIGMSGDIGFFVEIQNYGIGITESEIPMVFDEGFRGMYSIDRHRTGSGLGLSQVKKIVERHSGNVTITSQKASIQKGSGPWVTTLTVFLPFTQGEEALRYDQDLEDALG